MDKLLENLNEALISIAELEGLSVDLVNEDFANIKDIIALSLTGTKDLKRINLNEYSRTVIVMDYFDKLTTVVLTVKDKNTHNEPTKVEIIQYSDKYEYNKILFVDYLEI
jgi:hypothetical protein